MDVNLLVGLLQEKLRSEAGDGIEIRADLAPDLWTVSADSQSLERVLQNLVLNGQEAMPEGGTLAIQTENVQVTEEDCAAMDEAQAGAFVRITVRDSGTGMPADVLERIFEPFFSTKETGPGRGPGPVHHSRHHQAT